MKKQTPKLENVEALTGELFRGYFRGELEPWFDHLAPQCVWMGINEPTLYGAEAIRSHFRPYAKKGRANVLRDWYRSISVGGSAALVFGEITVGDPGASIYSVTQLTVFWKLVGENPMIVYHQMSYSTMGASLPGEGGSAALEGHARAFVHALLLQRPGLNPTRLLVRSGGEDIAVDPFTVRYLVGESKHVEVVCLDRVVSTSTPLKDFLPQLPGMFYQLHRSYIVNTNYITAIRRCEVELLTGEVLPIPTASYTKVRGDLEAILTRPERGAPLSK